MFVLRWKVRQADILYDEAEREVERRLAEAGGLKRAEEAHLAASLRLLEAAGASKWIHLDSCGSGGAKTMAAEKRLKEVEDATAEILAEREKQVQEMLEDMERKVGHESIATSSVLGRKRRHRSEQKSTCAW